MSVSAFNSSAFPRVSPFECFTVEWFSVLAQDKTLMEGLRNSLIIGFGVVLIAVPMGLAGALMLTQVSQRMRPWYYTIVISPILIPGVVLGISTLVFWDRLGTMFGAGYDSVFYNGIFLTIVGQSTFIAAYSMLVFISRLQRFESAQEEAALDLGATNVQAFPQGAAAIFETRHRLGRGAGLPRVIRELQHDRVHHRRRQHADHSTREQGALRYQSLPSARWPLSS